MVAGTAGTAAQTGVSRRIVCILRQFTHGAPAKRLTELSTGASLPLSTTHRLVTEMVNGGVLDRDEEGRYRVGTLVRTIADKHDRRSTRHRGQSGRTRQ